MVTGGPQPTTHGGFTMGFLQRISEPSTHAGIAAGISAVGTVAVQLGADAHTVTAVATGVQALFALLAVFLPEAGNTSAG